MDLYFPAFRSSSMISSIKFRLLSSLICSVFEVDKDTGWHPINLWRTRSAIVMWESCLWIPAVDPRITQHDITIINKMQPSWPAVCYHVFIVHGVPVGMFRLKVNRIGILLQPE